MVYANAEYGTGALKGTQTYGLRVSKFDVMLSVFTNYARYMHMIDFDKLIHRKLDLMTDVYLLELSRN